MIKVDIEYREATFKDEHFEDVCGVVEAYVGQVFEEEQSSIDIHTDDFSRFDDREDDLFITIEIEEKDIHHNLRMLTEQFTVQTEAFLTNYFGHVVPLRVWVQRIAGEFAEVWMSR